MSTPFSLIIPANFSLSSVYQVLFLLLLLLCLSFPPQKKISITKIIKNTKKILKIFVIIIFSSIPTLSFFLRIRITSLDIH